MFIVYNLLHLRLQYKGKPTITSKMKHHKKQKANPEM